VKKSAFVACCWLAAGLVCGIASGQSVGPADAASLKAAFEAAWQRSAQMPTVAGQLEVARANRSAAQALWAAPPAIEVGNRGEPFASTAGQRETEFGLAWPLLLPGQRAARGASSQADLSTADASQDAARLRIAGQVRESAWVVLLRRAELAIAEAHSKDLDALTADVERRVGAGDLARADALAARSEFLSAQSAATGGRQQLDAARARWVLLTGTSAVPDGIEAQIDAALIAVEDHPEMSLARLKTESARKRLDLVRATRSDPPELFVRYRNDVPAHNVASQSTIGLAIRIPFATTDRNRPREASAIAEVDVASAEERRTRERLVSEISSAAAAAAASELRLATEDSRAALLRERARLIDKSFRAGETALPELLRALAAALQAEGSLARQRAELGLSRALVQQAAGRIP